MSIADDIKKVLGGVPEETISEDVETELSEETPETLAEEKEMDDEKKKKELKEKEEMDSDSEEKLDEKKKSKIMEKMKKMIEKMDDDADEKGMMEKMYEMMDDEDEVSEGLKKDLVKEGKKLVKEKCALGEKKLKEAALKKEMKEEVDTLFSGEELSVDFKEKSQIIFETTVNKRVEELVEEQVAVLQEELVSEAQEAINDYKEELEVKLDSYLSYVTEEWTKKNELAIERGLRSEIVEDFMVGLRNLFTEHYIDVPEEKSDLVDDLFGKVEELQESLNGAQNSLIEAASEIKSLKRNDVLRSVSGSLSENEVSKLGELAEDVDFEDSKTYAKKLEIIKENYFQDAVITDSKHSVEKVEDDMVSADEVINSSTNKSMAVYLDAISKNNK